MKKIIIASAIALCGIMSIPAQAQQDLSAQPWRFAGSSLIPGGFFNPLVKVCYWKRGVYSAGIYSSEITTTKTSLFGLCPAPTVFN